MNILFPPRDESYIKAKIADGYYHNATELVRDAVRRLRESDDARHERLLAALEIGEEAARKGDFEVYTPALLEQIDQDAAKQARRGKPKRNARQS